MKIKLSFARLVFSALFVFGVLQYATALEIPFEIETRDICKKYFETAQILYFSNFKNAMQNCYSENFVSWGFDFVKTEKGNTILRYIILKNTDTLKEQKFFYVNGRIMSEPLKNSWEDFSPLYAESYGKNILNPNEMSHTKKKIIANLGKTENRRSNKPSSFILVQNFIFNAETQLQIEQELVRISFLGERITVHYKIRPALYRVEDKLKKEATTDWQVRAFIERPHTITGYNWREVRDSYQRSAHSWGLSIDYLEDENIRSSKQIYWRWAKGFYDDEWVTIPIKKRWLPSEKVIAIFESEGFVWGGKWELWDNMHFEYRPEVLYMSSHMAMPKN